MTGAGDSTQVNSLDEPAISRMPGIITAG